MLYYIEASVLLGNKPLVIFIRNYIPLIYMVYILSVSKRGILYTVYLYCFKGIFYNQ